MNAADYLKSQGWRGSGFSLHADKGLSKPLLTSRRRDQEGLGTKRNDFADQWWTKAFDKSLKGFQDGGVPVGDVAVVPPVPQKLPPRVTGLYSNFVKAETLGATFETRQELEEAKERNGKSGLGFAGPEKGSEGQDGRANSEVANTMKTAAFEKDERHLPSRRLNQGAESLNANISLTSKDPTGEKKDKKRKRRLEEAKQAFIGQNVPEQPQKPRKRRKGSNGTAVATADAARETLAASTVVQTQDAVLKDTVKDIELRNYTHDELQKKEKRKKKKKEKSTEPTTSPLPVLGQQTLQDASNTSALSIRNVETLSTPVKERKKKKTKDKTHKDHLVTQTAQVTSLPPAISPQYPLDPASKLSNIIDKERKPKSKSKDKERRHKDKG